MPIYTYICENDHEVDRVFPIHEERPKVLACPHCDTPSMRLFKPAQVIVMEPYVTSAADGIPTVIRTPNEERAYEKKHGLAHMTGSDMKNIRKRRESKLEPFAESYSKTKSRLDRQGKEFKKEQADKESHDMAEAIE